MTLLPLYIVQADAHTGEWMGAPEYSGRYVESAEHLNTPDTETEHHDTYEHGEGAYYTETETRAITVIYIKD